MTLAEFGAGKNVVAFHWSEKDGQEFCVKYRAQSPAGTLRILKKFRAAQRKFNLERKLFSKKEVIKNAKVFGYKWLAGVFDYINIKTDDPAGNRAELNLYPTEYNYHEVDLLPYGILATDNQN